MREYLRGDKKVFHSTDLWNYSICPKMMDIGRQREMEPNDAMREGLLMEGYVFGFKGGVEEQEAYEDIKLKKDGEPMANQLGKIEYYKRMQEEAKVIKEKFFSEDGKPFYRIEHEFKDYILTGELDWYADEVMKDLKRPQSIEGWLKKESKYDFLQAAYYNYIRHLNGGEIVPFEYIVAPKDVDVVKKFTVHVDEESLNWVADKVGDMVNDIFLSGDLTKCHNQIYGKCRYLGVCDDYLSKIVQDETIIFNELGE